jgi:hypothetical protein
VFPDENCRAGAGTALAVRVDGHEDSGMWHWFNCYLSGRHEYGVWCDPGVIFLRCVHCGRRSPGWTVDRGKPALARPRHSTTLELRQAGSRAPRILPFSRTDVPASATADTRG